MKLTIPQFKDGAMIPEKFTCKGIDVNPEIRWSDVPKETKSFALVMHDPDAPTGTFYHWLVKDISKDTRMIKEDSVPGIQVKNSWNKDEWAGPCPPSGVHRYIFTLYALDIETFPADDAKDLLKMLKKHCLQKASLTYKFSK